MIKFYLMLTLSILGVRGIAAAPDTLSKPVSNTQTINIVFTATQPASQTAAHTLPAQVKDDLIFWEWVLVFLPLTVFTFMFVYFMSWLKKDNYKLASALSGCDPITLTKTALTTTPEPALPGAAPAVSTVATTTTQDVLPRSSSRFIAFLTGMTAVSIGVVIVSVEIYKALAGLDKDSFDVDGLWKIIASLGIGIIPYGANMIKEASQDAAKKV